MSFKFDIEDAKTQFLYFEKRIADYGIIDNADNGYFVSFGQTKMCQSIFCAQRLKIEILKVYVNIL